MSILIKFFYVKNNLSIGKDFKNNMRFLFLLGPVTSILLYIISFSVHSINPFENDLIATAIATVIGRFFWFDTDYNSLKYNIRDFMPTKTFLKQMLLLMLSLIMLNMLIYVVSNDILDGIKLGINIQLLSVSAIIFISLIKDKVL